MRSLLTASMVASTVLLTACGGDGSRSVVNNTQTVSIQFAAQANGQNFKCGAVNGIANLGTSNTTAELQDLRFYASNFKLINDKGEEVALTLDKNDWQNYGVALIDFEDATGSCVEGTAQLNTTVTGKVTTGSYTGLRFTLGVPDTGLDATGKTMVLNHTEITNGIGAPLDLQAMAWSWQSGRKFTKIELKPVGGVLNQKGTSVITDDTTESTWFVHMGATGCTALVDKPTSYTCTSPNVADVKLAAFNSATQKVVLDIGALVAEADISKNENGAVGCMSGKTDAECAPIFKALQVNLATGLPMTGSAPTVFKAVMK